MPIAPDQPGVGILNVQFLTNGGVTPMSGTAVQPRLDRLYVAISSEYKFSPYCERLSHPAARISIPYLRISTSSVTRGIFSTTDCAMRMRS